MARVSSCRVSPWLTCYVRRPDAAVRLFCFPHGGGGPQVYRDWAEALPETIEVYAVSLPGRGARIREPLIRGMEELTAALLEGMRDFLDKPYAFFGHSVGALVAWELGRRIHAAGHPVPLRVFASAHTAPDRAADGEGMHRLSDEELVRIIRRLGLVPEEALESDELTALMLPPIKADFAVSETYRFVEGIPLPVPVTALGGREDDLVSEEDLRAWERHTEGGFEVRLFDGGHFYTQTHQEALLTFIAERTEADLRGLPLSILEGPREAYPSDRCLHDLFREQVVETPDRPAVSDIRRTLGFRELDEATDLLARYLQREGVGVDAIVGIFMESSVEYVTAYLGILKAGGAYMPLETEYPPALLQRVLKKADPVVVLTTPRFRDRLPESWRRAGRVFTLDDDWERRLQAEDLPVLDAEGRPRPDPDSLAYCVMTSGTTGEPKGIVCPHRGSVNAYTWRYRHLPYEDDEREACNVFFVWEVIRPLLQGIPSHVIPDDVIYDPPRLVDFLSARRITRVLFTPSLLEQILNTPDLDLAERLPDLRIVYLNGEVVPVALRNRFYQRLPWVRLINDYSISECHDVCTYDLADVDPRLSPKVAPLGPPMANVRVYVLDDDFQPVPRGMLGEVYVGGDSVARGYLDDPEKTAERFLPDPVKRDGSRVFRTGDLGRVLPNGHLEVVGRVQYMVKLRGYSIVLGAVETAICEHPAVNTAVVVTEDDPETGQPEALVAYVVGNGTVPDDALEKDLRPFLKERLPHYAIPSVFIPIESLPLHEVTGKLDRKKLPKPSEARRRAKKAPAAVAPEDHLERLVAETWSEVLKVDVIDGDDHFFDLGGHSLLAIRASTGLSRRLGITVSVIDIFEHPSVKLLAAHLRERLGPAEAAGAEEPAGRRARKVGRRAGAAADASLGREGSGDVAIVGMACRFPGASNLETFWRNLRDGVCSIRTFEDQELWARGVSPEVASAEGYVKAGAVLEDVDRFDPGFWGISRREAAYMDPQHRLFLECCWEALEQAGYPPRHTGVRTGVFAGCYLPSYLLHVLRGGGLVDPTDPSLFHLTEIGNDKDYLPTRVSYLLNLNGPSLAVQTSCSTAATAVATAFQALCAGTCDMALAGASSITFPQGGYQYVEGHVNSRDGRVRAFDADATGTVLGDGVGVVVLKRLEDALRNGDTVWAVIRAVAVNNDGNAKAGYSAPSVQGQADVIERALESAGVSADTLTYVEAHGTGTRLGDPIEVRALTQVFRRATDRKGFCALRSVKANIGHSNIAAGMAGLIKAALALKNRMIPPQIQFETPNPEMALEESPFTIATEPVHWTVPEGLPRRAGVSCFGIGGTNCHIVLEEAPRDTGRPRTERRDFIVTLSAPSREALERMRRNLADHLRSRPALDVGDVAYTLQVGREAFRHRIAVVAEDLSSAAEALEEAVPSAADAGGRSKPRCVFLFPGQGSQHLRMAYGLYRTEARYRAHFDRCAEILEPLVRDDLRSRVFASPQDDVAARALLKPQILQPALFSVAFALARTLMDWGIHPDAVGGHSIGEIVAACVAGVLTLEDALELVVTRARAIDAAPEGAMLSVRAGEGEVRRWIEEHPDLVVAAVNSPTDVVLSGPVEAVERASTVLEAADVMCRRVHVNRAFHSPMMADAAERLVTWAERVPLRIPRVPVLSNVNGRWMPQPLAASYWGEQLRFPVRFADNVRCLLEEPPGVILEVGPGRTLSTLMGRFRAERDSDAAWPLVLSTLPHPKDPESTDTRQFARTLAALWASGIDPDWKAYHASDRHVRVPLPTIAFDHKRCWFEAPETEAGLVTEAAGRPGSGKLPLDRRFYIPSWSRSLPPAAVSSGRVPAEVRLRWWVFLDRRGPAGAFSNRLADALEELGSEVTRVVREGKSAGSEGDLEENLVSLDPENLEGSMAELLTLRDRPDRVLFLWTLKDDPRPEDVYGPLVALSKALASQPASRPLGVWVVTTRTFQVDREPIDPARATLTGPCFVLPQEVPQVTCRVIDVAVFQRDASADERTVRRVLSECLSRRPDPEPVVVYRGGNRWVQRYEPVTVPAVDRGAGALKTGGVYVVTGGLGRIGQLLAEHLACYGAKIMLTDIVDFPRRDDWKAAVRSEKTHPRTRETIRRLLRLEEETGCRVAVLRSDVTRAQDMERLLREATEHFGGIHGIFHAAGVAHLKYLPELSEDISRLEFQPKVQGLLNLAEAVRRLREETGKAPEFVVLFSSLASILGGYGMTAYTAANRFMDAFASATSGRSDTRWVCVNWDDWDFKYTKEQVAAYEKTSARFAMPPAEGLEALERILARPGASQVLVATRPMEPRVQQWLHQKEWAEGEAPSGPDRTAAPGDELTEDADRWPEEGRRVDAGAGDPAEADGLVGRVAAVYGQVLGVKGLSPDDNFFDLGGDSLLAAQILLRLHRNVPEAKSVTLRAIFDHPTPRRLAAWVEKRS